MRAGRVGFRLSTLGRRKASGVRLRTSDVRPFRLSASGVRKASDIGLPTADSWI